MAELHHYALRIDGPLFRRQRELLINLTAILAKDAAYSRQPGDIDLLDRVISMLDEIADQAHDRHGIDCLLEDPDETAGDDEDDDRCDCEKPGYFCSGIPGILAHLEHGQVAEGTTVERCDQCARYPSDQAALERLRELGHVPP